MIEKVYKISTGNEKAVEKCKRQLLFHKYRQLIFHKKRQGFMENSA